MRFYSREFVNLAKIKKDSIKDAERKKQMISITTLDLQYAHRFYGFKGEAQYLHGHTGVLTIEVEDSVNEGVNMVFPCNEIKKIAWGVLKNFDHALVLREDDPLLPAVLAVYEKQGIRITFFFRNFL